MLSGKNKNNVPLNWTAFTVCLALFFTGAATVSFAEKYTVELSAGSGMLDGNTTYQIGGNYTDAAQDTGEYRFPISELKFPLAASLVWGKGCITFFDSREITGLIKHTSSHDAGRMEDRDWGVNFYTGDEWQNPDSLDIFSRSDAWLNATFTDTSLRLKFYDDTDRLTYWFGIGYLHQDMRFTASNLDQWYPSGEFGNHDFVAGPVLTYEVNYTIPYFEMAAATHFLKRYRLKTRIGFSPFARAHDEDHHLLTGKHAYGNAAGHAFLCSTAISMVFWSSFILSADFDLLQIYTTGKQAQYDDTAFFTSIETTIKSTQAFAGLSLGWQF